MPEARLIKTFSMGDHGVTLELIANNSGLCSCNLLNEPGVSDSHSSNETLQRCSQELSRYFGGKLQVFETDMALRGTPFQQAVWAATARIPFGEVRSYAWVAREIGNPRAVRAVAQALGANPVLLYVPCHRVISSDGTLGGFSCGLQWKPLFLALEGLTVSSSAQDGRKPRVFMGRPDLFLQSFT